MESLAFKGTDINECLGVASTTLGIPIESLDYTVLEEKKGFFSKRAEILVKYSIVCEDKSGSVKIESGKLVVKNPKPGGRPAIIIPSKDVKLIIDGDEITAKHEVMENSEISYYFDENEAKRFLNISLNNKKTEAYVTIEYIPKDVYGLKESEENCVLNLEAAVVESIYPPKYTKNEVKDELAKLGIKHGIVEENIEKCAEAESINALLIAKGVECIDDTSDSIELKFESERKNNEFEEDKRGTIDYRNVGSIKATQKDEIIAVKHDGKEGKDGIDIYGNVIKRKTGKKIALKIGEGCALKDDRTIISTIEGKPCIKNNMFYVYSEHEVRGDVDLKTGNIKFVGDVKIAGDVKEGMEVEAGNYIGIEKNVEHAKVISKGNVEIKGNIISSNITAGGNDAPALSYIDKINTLEGTLSSLMTAIVELKKCGSTFKKSTDGELIRVLLDKKFKNINKLCFDVILCGKMVTDNHLLEKVIKDKLIGLGPLNIKHFSEIDLILRLLNQEKLEAESLAVMPADLSFFYAQDSNLISTGNIFVNGKGIYTSNITGFGGVYFTRDRSVLRGGMIKAKHEIKAKVVGSEGRVTTKLIVGEEGHIWADAAYENTIFVIGKREFMLEVPSKNIHAYLDEDGEIVVDRLKL